MQKLKSFLIFTAVSVLLFSACKEPEGIGLEVLPDNEQMGIAWIDTFTVKAQTVRVDSVRTSARGTYVIGDFGDPIFGRVQSQMFTQFKLNAEPGPFSLDDQVDSVVLNLVYSGAYGRIDKLRGTHRFGIYEIQEDLHEDSTYYSDDTIQNIDMNPVAEFEFKPDLLNRVYSWEDDSLSTGPSLRVRLDNDLGARVLASQNLSSNDVFSEEFEGLNVRSLTPQMPNDEGSLLYFNMESDNSRLELYYHNSEDTTMYPFDMDNRNAIFTNVDHEFSQELIDAMNGGTLAGEQKLYIQSLAGTRIRASFPNLRDLNDLGYVAINKAELVLPVDESSLDDFGLPTILAVNNINAGDSALVIIDSFEPDGIDYYGGIYDSDNQEYVFNIARHLQSILNNPNETDYGIYITSLNAVDGRRGVFNGPGHPTRPMKLRMTYTIID